MRCRFVWASWCNTCWGWRCRGWRMAGGEQAMVLMIVGIVLCYLYNLCVIRLHSRVTSKFAQAEVVPPHAYLAGGSAFLALSLGLLGAQGIGYAAY